MNQLQITDIEQIEFSPSVTDQLETYIIDKRKSSSRPEQSEAERSTSRQISRLLYTPRPLTDLNKKARHCEEERRSNLKTIAITHSFKIASSAEKAFSQ